MSQILNAKIQKDKLILTELSIQKMYIIKQLLIVHNNKTGFLPFTDLF